MLSIWVIHTRYYFIFILLHMQVLQNLWLYLPCRFSKIWHLFRQANKYVRTIFHTKLAGEKISTFLKKKVKLRMRHKKSITKWTFLISNLAFWDGYIQKNKFIQNTYFGLPCTYWNIAKEKWVNSWQIFKCQLLFGDNRLFTLILVGK